MMMRTWWRGCLATLSLAVLHGCAATGDVSKPIPTLLVPAPETAQRLVVMLPGRGDDLQGLEKHHAAQIIQRQWPHTDVLLTGLTMPYYTDGVATKRLHDEVMVPAKKRGYRQIWLAGISLGGMGSLLYDRAYPGEVTGMLLFSPYLGDRKIHDEIRKAGGLARWKPGPPEPIGPDTFPRELWRYLKSWSNNSPRTSSVWLAYGDRERFREPIELVTPALPANHVLMLPGHHNWKLWTPAMRALFGKAANHGAGDSAPASAGQRRARPSH